MNKSFLYNATKVWNFLEDNNLIPMNNYLTSKELYETIIDKNPGVLLKYSEYKITDNKTFTTRDKEISERKNRLTQRRLDNLNENITDDLPSIYDIQYWNSSRVFEAEEMRINNPTPDELQNAEKVYDELLEKLKNGKELDEGFLTGLLGGAAGALIGPAIGKAICRVLGIDENGHFGKLLTSRLVTTAMGYELGK